VLLQQWRSPLHQSSTGELLECDRTAQDTTTRALWKKLRDLDAVVPAFDGPGSPAQCLPTRAGKAVRTRRAFPWSTGQARRTAPKPLPSGTIGGGPSCTGGAWGRKTQVPCPHRADFSHHSSNISGHL